MGAVGSLLLAQMAAKKNSMQCASIITMPLIIEGIQANERAEKFATQMQNVCNDLYVINTQDYYADYHDKPMTHMFSRISQDIYDIIIDKHLGKIQERVANIKISKHNAAEIAEQILKDGRYIR